MAKARRMGADDALLVDRSGRIDETTVGNVLMHQRFVGSLTPCRMPWLGLSSLHRQLGMGEVALTRSAQKVVPGWPVATAETLLRPLPLAVVNAVAGPRQAVLRSWQVVPEVDLSWLEQRWEAVATESALGLLRELG